MTDSARKPYEEMTTEELFALYGETRDQDLKWEIALRYTGLIRSIALQIRGVFCSFTQLDDIINEGLIVLADAVDKFDPEKGRFEMYVAKRIRGMIVDLARQQDWVPRTVRQRAQRIDKAVTEMYNQTGKMPSDSEVAEKLGITIEEYREAMANASLHNILSLDEVFEGNDSWEAAADPESGGHPEQALMGEELVEETFMPRRNRVVMSSREGKMENSRASDIFMVISRIITERAMLMTRRTSSIKVGRGKIRNSTTTTTNRETALSSIRFMGILPSFFWTCLKGTVYYIINSRINKDYPAALREEISAMPSKCTKTVPASLFPIKPAFAGR